MRSHWKHLLLAPCRTPDELHDWVRCFTSLDLPRVPVCAHHDAPFDYLCASYFEPATDLIIHAPRGGGKTRLAALATLLDLLHKPGVSVRILGGSFEQSLRTWEHLVPGIEQLAGDLILKPRSTGKRLRLRSRSNASVLTQSQRAVRGLRVQKLRCDEVELFDPDVWEAAQLVTRSGQLSMDNVQNMGEHSDVATAASAHCRPRIAHRVNGTIEALSTHHRPFGLMQKILDAAAKNHSPRVIRWCLMEVLQKCEPDRDCKTCPLWNECRGLAKSRCNGFIPIDDAIAMKQRVSEDCWNAEMLCKRPSVRGCVFPTFDEAVHVVEAINQPSPASGTGQNSQITISPSAPAQLCLAIDFGFANPFVCLFIRATGYGASAGVHVVDEYVQTQQTLDVHLKQIQSRGYGTVSWVACDPAGAGRNDQTADSNVAALRRAGYRVRFRATRIVDGLEAIRAALRPAAGKPRLFVHPRCVRLIAALKGYRYADGEVLSELPVKDGQHDHLIDALRYFLVNNIDRRLKVGGIGARAGWLGYMCRQM